jgi:putative toxin-antitoxin system antitoxin component (TIGR02293 family)
MIPATSTTTEHYRNLTNLLGQEFVQGKVESPFDFLHIARKGVDANIIRNFREGFNLTLEDTARMLNTSEPTLYRWTRNNKKLDSNFTIKLFEITDLFLYGREVFGSQENFFKWLNLPNMALGGIEPQELIEIPEGISKVRDILGRIEHGVYS